MNTIAELKIKWTDNSAPEVAAGVVAKQPILIEVDDPYQVGDWQRLLRVQADESLDPQVTVAIIQAAVSMVPIMALAGILAYAMSRRYRVTFKKARTTVQFELAPQ